MPRRPCPAPGCTREIHASTYGQFYGCFTCWHRLPHNLRAAYVRAVRVQMSPGLLYSHPEMRGASIELRKEIDTWWTENPPMPAEPAPPAWKRNRGTS